MKKLMAFLMIAALLLGLTACGAKQAEAPAATEEPAAEATEEPTAEPTEEPTEAPAEEPTEAPTEEPTEAPTDEPTEAPTDEPTEAPTEEPTEAPTEEPTEAPTEEPTEAPTEEPTEAPTEEPAVEAASEAVEDETEAAAEADEAAAVSLANPWEETSAEAIMESLGYGFNLPENAEGAIYRVNATDQLAEVQFTIDGTTLTGRVKSGSEAEDISGAYYDWEYVEDCQIDGRDATVNRVTDGDRTVDVCMWYDVAPGLNYSVMAEAADLDGFDITAVASQLFPPVQGDSDGDAGEPEGEEAPAEAEEVPTEIEEAPAEEEEAPAEAEVPAEEEEVQAE